MLIIEHLAERDKIRIYKLKILELMSIPDFSHITDYRLKRLINSNSDLNNSEKAIRSLREEGLIASSQGTSKSHLEEEIPYDLTQRGRDQAGEIKEVVYNTIEHRKREEKWIKQEKKRRKMERKDFIKIAIAVFIFFPLLSLILTIVVGLLIT